MIPYFFMFVLGPNHQLLLLVAAERSRINFLFITLIQRLQSRLLFKCAFNGWYAVIDTFNKICFVEKCLDFLQKASQKWFSVQLSGVGLGAFRISFFLILSIEIFWLIHLKKLLFSNSGPLVVVALWIWLISAVSVAIGFGGVYSRAVNYLFCISFFGRMVDFQYHIDFMYLGISFVSIFVPINSRFSFDNYIFRRREQRVSQVYYYLIVLVGLGFFYFESVFHKLNSAMWINGLGFWLPTSMPNFVSRDWAFLLNMYPIMLGLGYIVLLFEAVFIFLFWFKKARPILLIVGISLHLGIAITYPIPLFGAAMCSLYFLVVPDKWFRNLNFKSPDNGPADRISGVSLIIAAAIFQVVSLLSVPQMGHIIGTAGNVFRWVSSETKNLRMLTFGMYPHAIFVDDHFSIPLKDYKVIAWIDGNESQINVVNDFGGGRVWTNWGFRMPDPNEKQDVLKKMGPYLRWYLRKFKEQDPSADIVFQIDVRSFLEEEFVWRKDYFLENAAKPWTNLGKVKEVNGDFVWMN